MNAEKLLKRWIAALGEGLHSEADEKTRMRIMERCGQACAVHHDSVETVKRMREKTASVDELLEMLNREEGFWCGDWVRDGEVIYSVCKKCGCPMVAEGLVELSPFLCHCSLGWVRAVFEVVLGRPVRVELAEAIGKGDSVCRYVVRGGSGRQAAGFDPRREGREHKPLDSGDQEQ